MGVDAAKLWHSAHQEVLIGGADKHVTSPILDRDGAQRVAFVLPEEHL